MALWYWLMHLSLSWFVVSPIQKCPQRLSSSESFYCRAKDQQKAQLGKLHLSNPPCRIKSNLWSVLAQDTISLPRPPIKSHIGINAPPPSPPPHSPTSKPPPLALALAQPNENLPWSMPKKHRPYATSVNEIQNSISVIYLFLHARTRTR